MVGDTLEEIQRERYNKKIEAVEDVTGISIRNQNDELKVKIIARLYKNLTLEQLENVEVSVQRTLFDKKNYIYVLP